MYEDALRVKVQKEQTEQKRLRNGAASAESLGEIVQGLWETQCQLRPKLNAYEGDGDVTSDRGNTETAGNPDRVPASKLGRYPTEQVQDSLLRWAEN